MAQLHGGASRFSGNSVQHIARSRACKRAVRKRRSRPEAVGSFRPAEGDGMLVTAAHLAIETMKDIAVGSAFFGIETKNKTGLR